MTRNYQRELAINLEYMGAKEEEKKKFPMWAAVLIMIIALGLVFAFWREYGKAKGRAQGAAWLAGGKTSNFNRLRGLTPGQEY